MSFVLNRVSVRRGDGASATLAIHEASLKISAGEQVALIGPSGAGKTTLLHTLACALQPSSGELQAFGECPWQISSRARHALRKRFYLAPQTPPLPPRQRVVTTVLAGRLPRWTLGQALKSLIKPVDAQAAFDILARFGLQHKLYARVDRLSGGERQRCSMARLLMSDAEAFLIDEPLSALDPTLAQQSLQILQQEASQRGASMICSLHQVELALGNFSRIIGMREGKIIFDAPRVEVSEEMIRTLYLNESVALHPAQAIGEVELPSVPITRCF